MFQYDWQVQFDDKNVANCCVYGDLIVYGDNLSAGVHG
jgi:hypothetical protein